MIGIQFSTVLGLLHVLGAGVYFAISINQLVTATRTNSGNDTVFRTLQLIFSPIILLLSGAILIFQGWRLDPILLFQVVLTTFLIAYLIWLDLRR